MHCKVWPISSPSFPDTASLAHQHIQAQCPLRYPAALLTQQPQQQRNRGHVPEVGVMYMSRPRPSTYTALRLQYVPVSVLMLA